ncbi:MAG: DEAD/DEAH box helicase family protein [Anaerolineae bacterium]|nr:DEAD/DEAH box helicase family protein [Anaerolineae bacterium]
MLRLESYLVLNRYLHHLLGADDLEALKALLRPMPEGPEGSGQSYFLARLVTQPGLRLPREDLERYDRRVMAYEAELRRARRDFKGFRYFQYLALLYTEVFLDRLTADPRAFAADLNRFLDGLRQSDRDLADFPSFEPGELRRLAFFMATGSGKTLLMHVNIRQVLHYLEHGRHPEALLPGQPRGRGFDNILLITPNEGLSAQHIAELRASGLGAELFIENPNARGSSLVPLVKVIEIHKLADEPSRDGVSVVLEAIGQRNLVLVDEGHKGTGSLAQTWKNRQKYLSESGFLLEYSATFAQAIGAASAKAQAALLREYGRAILFDYSYAHFYGDGYGKDFVVLNLQSARPDQAHELLVGGLLTFFHQLHVYEAAEPALRPYNLERPLWVLLGSSVNALYTQDRERRSDVAEVVAFLRRFFEDPAWAVRAIDRVLRGQSGFQDRETGEDLFAPHIPRLREQPAAAVYDAIRQTIFRGSGGLEVWRLKRADGELGLRLSAMPEGQYFGVINIGDAPAFEKYLAAHLGLSVKEDSFTPSLFAQVDLPGSPIHILIGARKFIEGWSSWRVSSMGLLNVGKGEGSQIIQLFGRGVRLKGKGMSLKRSAALEGEGPHPPDIRHLETLTIFGWNADYVQTFRAILENEDIRKELVVPVHRMEPWPRGGLPVPERHTGFDPSTLTWTLDATGPVVELDLSPRVAALETKGAGLAVREGSAEVYGVRRIDFDDPLWAALVDEEALYLELIAYKQIGAYWNLYIPATAPGEVLRKRCRLRLPERDCRPEVVSQAAAQLVRTYVDRFVRAKEREADSAHARRGVLDRDDPRLIARYRLRVRAGKTLEAIRRILEEGRIARDLDELRRGAPVPDWGEPLPRLYFDRSLHNPLLAEGGAEWKGNVSVSPPALNAQERRFLSDLRAFWQQTHTSEPWAHCELYVLRNVALGGIGLFHRSGFYPDFVVWLRDSREGTTRVIFVDPHGLHHGGLSRSQDKFAALLALRGLSEQEEFRRHLISLDGYILTQTPVAQIADAAGRTQAELERDYPLRWMEGSYIQRILGIEG